MSLNLLLKLLLTTFTSESKGETVTLLFTLLLDLLNLNQATLNPWRNSQISFSVSTACSRPHSPYQLLIPSLLCSCITFQILWHVLWLIVKIRGATPAIRASQLEGLKFEGRDGGDPIMHQPCDVTVFDHTAAGYGCRERVCGDIDGVSYSRLAGAIHFPLLERSINSSAQTSICLLKVWTPLRMCLTIFSLIWPKDRKQSVDSLKVQRKETY